MTAVLQDSLDHCFTKKDKRYETILVVTDGEPDDRKSVFVIIRPSQKITADEELAISFIQISDDPQARQFLKALDDNWIEVGAKFDIVDTVTFDQIEDMAIAAVLTNAIID